MPMILLFKLSGILHDLFYLNKIVSPMDNLIPLESSKATKANAGGLLGVFKSMSLMRPYCVIIKYTLRLEQEVKKLFEVFAPRYNPSKHSG